MKDLEKRQGDIFEEAGQTLTFAQLFPSIETIAIEVIEEGADTHGMGMRRFRNTTAREYVNCSSVSCSGKGLSLGKLLRQMVAERQTHASFDQVCEGHTGEAIACTNRFRLDVLVVYRS